MVTFEPILWEEEFMIIYHIRRIVRLNEKAERHAIEYKKLSGDPDARSKAVWHQRKSEQLYSQISGLIRGFTFATK